MGKKLKKRINGFKTKPAFTGFVLFCSILLLNIVIQTPGKFFSLQNISLLLSKNLPLILVCMGQAVLIMAGVLDMSSGIQLAFVNVLAIMIPQELGTPVWVGWALALLGGVFISVVCGLCIVHLRLPALLTSFSLTYVIKGINVIIMSEPQGKVDKIIYQTYGSNIAGIIPFTALILFAVIVVWAYISKTRYGKHMYAVGNNERNAYAIGIDPVRVQMKAYIIKGVIIGIAGLCLTASNASGNPLQAEEYGMRSLSACILGGMNFGGWGTMSCALFGAGFLVLIQNTIYYFFNMLSKAIPGFIVNSYWQNFVSDTIIFLGLLATIFTSKGQRDILNIGKAPKAKSPGKAHAKLNKEGT